MDTKGTSELYYWDSDHVDINCCKGTVSSTEADYLSSYESTYSSCECLLDWTHRQVITVDED